jgi:predicted nucleotidyltransferase
MATTVDQAARQLKQRASLHAARAAARAARLRDLLPNAKRLLVELGARRVCLFGSLATGRVTERSDVDLGVEGLPASVYFTALAELMRVFRGPVDLVRLEDAPDTLKERITAEGIEL